MGAVSGLHNKTIEIMSQINQKTSAFLLYPLFPPWPCAYIIIHVHFTAFLFCLCPIWLLPNASFWLYQVHARISCNSDLLHSMCEFGKHHCSKEPQRSASTQKKSSSRPINIQWDSKSRHTQQFLWLKQIAWGTMSHWLPRWKAGTKN